MYPALGKGLNESGTHVASHGLQKMRKLDKSKSNEYLQQKYF